MKEKFGPPWRGEKTWCSGPMGDCRSCHMRGGGAGDGASWKRAGRKLEFFGRFMTLTFTRRDSR